MSDDTPLSPLRQAIRDLIRVLVIRHPSSNRQEFADSMGEFSARTWRRARATGRAKAATAAPRRPARALERGA